MYHLIFGESIFREARRRCLKSNDNEGEGKGKEPGEDRIPGEKSDLEAVLKGLIQNGELWANFGSNCGQAARAVAASQPASIEGAATSSSLN